MFIKSVTGSSPLTFENHLRPQQLYVNLHDGGDPSLPPNGFRNCDIAMEYNDRLKQEKPDMSDLLRLSN